MVRDIFRLTRLLLASNLNRPRHWRAEDDRDRRREEAPFVVREEE